ncbi:hypothetical protein B1987_13555 [Mycobacterium kansasii]|nr:hypothetical protein B1987_13555 [Mycobacterium kansasii]
MFSLLVLLVLPLTVSLSAPVVLLLVMLSFAQVSSLNPSWAVKVMASLPTLTVGLLLALITAVAPVTAPVSASVPSATAAPRVRRRVVAVGPAA